VVTGNASLPAHIEAEAGTKHPFRTFVSRYFYFCMSLVMAGLVMVGFGRTVDHNLFHANPPRPLLLWIHGTVFSMWVVFFILQSALVRVQRVSVHRTLGWFGAALATVMTILGVVIAVVMARFDVMVLHQANVEAFLSIPFFDMLVFGTCMGLAIYWRKKPQYHRRLIFIASCHLMDAAVGRFDFIFDNSLFYPTLDCLILLGALRDRFVDGRISRVYVYALPPVFALQALAVYAWRVNPAWWQGITHAIVR